jgi:non-homologous end joining protein Ku
LEDRYRSILVSMLKEKHGKQIPAVSGAKKPTASNALNLMEVLKRSLEAESPRRARPGVTNADHSEAAAAADRQALRKGNSGAAEGAQPESSLKA